MEFEELLRRAEAGDGEAAQYLGEGFLHGVLGSPPDDERAFYWNTRAAQAGRPRGMTNLGVLYLEGRYVERDYAKARAYFKEASEKGDMKAPRYLGLMYLEGDIPSDAPGARAAEWFHLGAQRGDITSQYQLGKLYEEGAGVPQDRAEAVRWYRLSAQRGDAIAQPAIDALKRLGEWKEETP